MKNLRRLAFQFADANQISHPFNAQLKLAGLDWADGFLKKHKLSLRTPSKTSLARVSGFNKAQVDIFFNNLEILLTKYKFPASRIFNMDESSTTTVPNKTPKVVSVQGKKGVGKISSAERGTLSTVICTVSASGNYVPPAIVFARKRVKPELMNGAPPDSIMLCSDSGYSNSDLFLVWLKHFQKHVVSSESNPVLLILDNHSSHICIESVLFCRQHSIHLLSIPPHSSHKIQPLDKVFFKPLKDYLSQMSDNWLVNHPGRVITQYQIAEIFGQAYEKTATMGKGVNGFRVCGIFPFNRDVFSEDDFIPSLVTDQQIPEANTTQSDDHPTVTDIQSVASTSNAQQEVSSDQNLAAATDQDDKLNGGEVISAEETPNKNRPVKTWTSPVDLFPIPKRQEAQKRKSKKQKSQIITSSPFKDQLIAGEVKKRQAEEDRCKKLAKKFKKNFSSSTPKAKPAIDQPSTSTGKIACPACEEEYTDPPEEDWIQCFKCQEWWHDACSNYEGGSNFVCDYC